jgi:hypothetical protein
MIFGVESVGFRSNRVTSVPPVDCVFARRQSGSGTLRTGEEILWDDEMSLESRAGRDFVLLMRGSIEESAGRVSVEIFSGPVVTMGICPFDALYARDIYEIFTVTGT